MAERKGVSLAARIVALAVGGIVIASIGAFVITFRGPPPRPAPTKLTDVAAVLGGRGTIPPGTRPVTVTRAARPPSPHQGEHRDAAREGALARMANVPAGDVRLFYAPTGPDLPGGDLQSLRGDFTAAARQGDRWRIVRTRPQPWITPWHRVSLLAMSCAVVALGLIAWAIARTIARPLARLAQAAHEVRIGHRPAPVDPEGPPEVRQVAEAMNAMQERIAGQLASRTAMLAAVAHDLGTPLSRLAFHLEKLPDAEREKAEAEMGEMRAMIGSVIDFARADPARMKREPVDLAALAAKVSDTRAGAPVMVSGDAVALGRMVANLVENARRYAGAFELGCFSLASEAVLEVGDQGPGIAPDLLPSIFEPFVRGEPSRNRETGGTGLGLSIVRQIAEAHGGSVSLRNRATRGLIAEVRLPLLQ